MYPKKDNAMDKELESLYKNDVWEVMELTKIERLLEASKY